ncbi:ribonuclease R [bacterium]|nr:ribonuclease R [bacterium]
MSKKFQKGRRHSRPDRKTGRGRAEQEAWIGTVRRIDAGAGFFVPEDKTREDLFLKGAALGGAQDRDRVRAVPQGSAPPGRRREGRVIEVLERGMRRIIGELRRHGAFYYLLPMIYRVYETITVEPDDLAGAREGDRVAAELIGYAPMRAKIIEVIGASGSPDVEMKTVLAKYSVPRDFPRDVRHEADKIPDRPAHADLSGRTDLRRLPILTIDPIDARDLDDAISFERLADGHARVGVHIADVSHYVQPGSALEDEAVERGTSIYLVDGVIPMLPPKLSNGICSLNAGEDRLTLSAFLNYSPDGRLLGASFARSVIHVGRRFHYDEVDEIFDRQVYPPKFEFLRDLAELARNIRARRSDRGSIDFDFPEVKLILDERGKVKDVKVMTHTLSHQLIEEYMIGANEAVAEYLTARKLPMIYRVHAEPEPAKLLVLEQFLFNLGVKVKLRGKFDGPRGSDSKTVARRIQTLLAEVKGGPWERVVNYQLLRSMPKAIYATQNVGHFGLGSSCYCHFTSPIRRYPDLTVHRMLSAVLQKKMPPKPDLKKIDLALTEAAKRSTEREIEAAEAERESVKVKLLEDMQSRVGEIYTGTISGVVTFGCFVQLPNTVEGLLHVSSMTDDHYRLSEITASLVGRNTGKRHRIGDEVRVRVERVDLPLRQLDFSLAK